MKMMILLMTTRMTITIFDDYVSIQTLIPTLMSVMMLMMAKAAKVVVNLKKKKIELPLLIAAADYGDDNSNDN